MDNEGDDETRSLNELRVLFICFPSCHLVVSAVVYDLFAPCRSYYILSRMCSFVTIRPVDRSTYEWTTAPIDFFVAAMFGSSIRF